MKTVTRYQAADGSIHPTEKEALKRDRIVGKVRRIMKPLGVIPKEKGCGFANGDGYIQHNIVDVRLAKIKLIAYGQEIFGNEGPVSFNYMGRVFSDYNIDVFYNAWVRLACHDEMGREWGQQYYAVNPAQGVQKPYDFSK